MVSPSSACAAAGESSSCRASASSAVMTCEEVERLRAELELMRQSTEVALRALDAHLSDAKWSAIAIPPDGSKAGGSFDWGNHDMADALGEAVSCAGV